MTTNTCSNEWATYLPIIYTPCKNILLTRRNMPCSAQSKVGRPLPLTPLPECRRGGRVIAHCEQHTGKQCGATTTAQVRTLHRAEDVLPQADSCYVSIPTQF